MPETETTAYMQGRQACDAGESKLENPYPMCPGYNRQRMDWFNGWYDRRLVLRFSHSFGTKQNDSPASAAARRLGRLTETGRFLGGQL